jgi:hypothetical protein
MQARTARVRCHMQAHHGGGYGLRASLPPLNPAAPGPYRYLKAHRVPAYPDGVKPGLDFFRACDRGGRKRTGEDQSRAAIRITTRMSVPPPPPPSPAENLVEDSMKKYFDACAKDGKDSPEARIALENYKAALQLQAEVCEPHTTALEQAWRCL